MNSRNRRPSLRESVRRIFANYSSFDSRRSLSVLPHFRRINEPVDAYLHAVAGVRAVDEEAVVPERLGVAPPGPEALGDCIGERCGHGEGIVCALRARQGLAVADNVRILPHPVVAQLDGQRCVEPFQRIRRDFGELGRVGEAVRGQLGYRVKRRLEINAFARLKCPRNGRFGQRPLTSFSLALSASTAALSGRCGAE